MSFLKFPVAVWEDADGCFTAKTLEVTRRIHGIAADCGMDPVTFAVAWTLTRDFVGSTIIGVTHTDQLDANLAAADAKIPDDALTAVDALSREIRYPMG